MMVCADVTLTLDSFARWLEGQELTAAPRRGRAKKVTYCAEIGAFDIETTNIPEIKQAVLYHWQFQWSDRVTVIGRQAEEVPKLFDLIGRKLNEAGLCMLVFVHNLSFEFQFMAGWHHFLPDDTLVVDDRTILSADWGPVEFRCSYLQSGQSLSTLCKKYNVAHGKLSGDDFDYHKQRYPWTPMSEAETEYCLNDVRGLVEAMDARREERGDTWYSFPLYQDGLYSQEGKTGAVFHNPVCSGKAI